MSNFGKPSKKIFILILCALTAISLILINKFYRPEEPVIEVKQFQNTRPAPVQKTDTVLIDTDSDGLPDWQEIITGTDIKKADTDGDGTNDSAELKLGRDPTIAGPKDQDSNIQATSTIKATAGTETVSDTVARNMFANAVYMSNSGEITEESKDALVQNLISGIQQSFVYNEYPSESLKVVTIDNVDNLRFYASNFATLQIGMILQMQNNISGIEKNLSVLGKIYDKQASDLYSLEVPSSLKDIHLRIVNNYSKGGAVFEAMSKEKEDPLKLPFAIKTYQEITLSQPQLIKQIAQFIKDSGIIFTSNEVGGYWNAFE